MVSPKMLVARSQYLGGLRARMVGSSSRTQSHNDDGLPPRPNAAMARANDNIALRSHSMTLPRFTTRVGVREDIQEGVEVGNVNGVCSKCLVKKL